MSQKEFIENGTVIFKQGIPGSHAYVIESGKIEVTHKDEDGSEIFLAELGPGEMVGEIAVMFGGARTANVQASADTVLIPVSAQELYCLTALSRQMCLFIVSLATGRMDDTQQKIHAYRARKEAGAADCK